MIRLHDEGHREGFALISRDNPKDYVCVNRIIETALELRSYQLNVESIRVVTRLDPNLPKTMVDSHQLQRVFLNIIINAHQAMASQGGGDLMLQQAEHDQALKQISPCHRP